MGLLLIVSIVDELLLFRIYVGSGCYGLVPVSKSLIFVIQKNQSLRLVVSASFENGISHVKSDSRQVVSLLSQFETLWVQSLVSMNSDSLDMLVRPLNPSWIISTAAMVHINNIRLVLNLSLKRL